MHMQHTIRTTHYLYAVALAGLRGWMLPPVLPRGAPLGVRAAQRVAPAVGAAEAPANVLANEALGELRRHEACVISRYICVVLLSLWLCP